MLAIILMMSVLMKGSGFQRKVNIRHIVLVVLLAFPDLGIAQDFSIAEYEILTISGIKDPINSAQDSLEVIVNHFHFFGAFPLVQKERLRVINGVAYDLWLLNFDQYSLQARRPGTLHYLRYQLGFINYRWNFWRLIGVVAPGLSTDFNNGLTTNDFRIQGMLLAINSVSENFQYGIGAGFTTDFGSPSPVPIVNISWQTNSKFRISGLLPKNLGIWYVPSQDREFGVRAAVSGSQFHLKEAGPQRMEDVDVKYSVLSLGPEYKQKVAGSIFLKLEGGYTLFRKFRFEGPNGKNDLDLENNIFFRGGLVFRPDFAKY